MSGVDVQEMPGWTQMGNLFWTCVLEVGLLGISDQSRGYACSQREPNFASGAPESCVRWPEKCVWHEKQRMTSPRCGRNIERGFRMKNTVCAWIYQAVTVFLMIMILKRFWFSYRTRPGLSNARTPSF